jgi:plastocyanin
VRRCIRHAPSCFVLAAGLSLSGLGIAGAVPTAAAPSPPPDEVRVAVTDSAFTPTVIDLRRGGSVVWDWDGALHHTATDTTGMELFDITGAPGDPSASFTYVGAGSYSYYCILHPWMGGRVSVPMRAAPRRAGVHHRFLLTWARAPAPAGSVFDVQVQRPGGRWRPLVVGASGREGTFVPDAGRGRYRFRARMRSAGSGASARWSDPVGVRAGPARATTR